MVPSVWALGASFFWNFKRFKFSRGPWQIWEILQLLKLYFLKVCCIIPKNCCFWEGYRTERLFQFFVHGWVFFVHGWVLFVHGWVLIVHGWVLFVHSWVLFVQSWVLFVHGWVLIVARLGSFCATCQIFGKSQILP